jgi:hypothetical protein
VYFCEYKNFLVQPADISLINLCYTGLNSCSMDRGGKYNSSWNEFYSKTSFSKFLNFVTNIFLTEVPKISEIIIRNQDRPLVKGVPQVIPIQNVMFSAD